MEDKSKFLQLFNLIPRNSEIRNASLISNVNPFDETDETAHHVSFDLVAKNRVFHKALRSPSTNEDKFSKFVNTGLLSREEYKALVDSSNKIFDLMNQKSARFMRMQKRSLIPCQIKLKRLELSNLNDYKLSDEAFKFFQRYSLKQPCERRVQNEFSDKISIPFTKSHIEISKISKENNEQISERGENSNEVEIFDYVPTIRIIGKNDTHRSGILKQSAFKLNSMFAPKMQAQKEIEIIDLTIDDDTNEQKKENVATASRQSRKFIF